MAKRLGPCLRRAGRARTCLHSGHLQHRQLDAVALDFARKRRRAATGNSTVELAVPVDGHIPGVRPVALAGNIPMPVQLNGCAVGIAKAAAARVEKLEECATLVDKPNLATRHLRRRAGCRKKSRRSHSRILSAILELD